MLDSDLVTVATDQAENLQGNVQPGRDVRMEKEEEKRLDADEPEGSATKTHPKDGDCLNSNKGDKC